MERNIELLKVKEIVHGRIELRSDDVLIFRPNVATFKEFNLQVLQDLLDAFVEITDGVPRLYLCDNTYTPAIVSKDDLDFMSKKYPIFATKAAMITDSPIARVQVANYNSVYDPTVKLGAFVSEESAIEWLLKA
ncbi:hypothetical protein CW751_14350 [Brumimicrobium salinarum]|uniref:DUF7793 domain-containing protein n=1 Tax=Brumimicrobium salinarum TaxID=2058658 RepID=A0A2I0QZ40_9FLAO|nr:hypothetical protein [Brumimicrobium salinarum]PKR79595.1 hypothetical protein CW751_14350 [Brumimicrobium salinarum]